MKGGTIGLSGAGEGRLHEQEQGQDQDRRRPRRSLATGCHTHGPAGRGSVRVEEDPGRAGGLHKTAPPPPPRLSGFCCRPVDPAKSHSGALVLAFVTRFVILGLGTGYCQTESRKVFWDRTSRGGDPALRQLCHSRSFGIALCGLWIPWLIRNWWWFLELQVS